MHKFLLLGAGGLLLIVLMALASFASAAPPLNPPLQSVASPTPVQASADNTLDQNAPEVGAALTPVPPGLMTSRIIVFNPGVGTATVGITIIRPNGTTAYTFPTFNVVANGAVVRPLPTGISSPFSGSAVVSSNKSVQAYVMDTNAPGTARDEYNGSAGSSSTLTLPLVRHLAVNTRHSIIAVQNTSSTAGNVTLHLYNSGGFELASAKRVVTVQPSASAYINTDAIFGSTAFIGSGLLVADPGLTIAAAEQMEYFQDTASFQGLTTADAGTNLYVPFVERRRNSTGSVLSWDEIFVRNNGLSPTDITAQIYTAAGALKLSVTRSAVPSNGQAQFLLNTSAFSSLTSSAAYFSGWVKLTSSGQPISAYVLDAQNSGGYLFGFRATPFAQVGPKYACGDVFRISSPSQMSKLNLVNLASTTAGVTIRLYNASTGALAGSKTYSIGPNKQVVAALSDPSFGPAGSSFEGLATITSGGRLLVSVNTQYSTGGITSFDCSKLP